MSTSRSGASRTRAVVIGGTGAVGRVVAAELVARGVDVTVVARNPARTASAPEVDVVALDVADQSAVRRLIADRGPDIAVMCVEPAGTAVHRALLDAGVSVVDVTASADRMAAIQDLGQLARQRGASAVLSVGVAPGLTNVAALEVHGDLGAVDELELTLLFGAGEAHGVEGLRWLLESFGDERIAHLRPKRARLPGHGARMTYPAAFSDQFTLGSTLGIPDVTTRMALDSRLATAMLFSRSTASIRHWMVPAAASALERWNLGSVLGGDGFVVMATGRLGSRTAVRWISGRGQSRATALVAATTAVSVLVGEVPAGVHHLEQLPATVGRVEALEDGGLVFGRGVLLRR